MGLRIVVYKKCDVWPTQLELDVGVYYTIAIYHSYGYNAIVFAILHGSALHTSLLERC